MPATERALRVTDAYRAHLLQLRRHLVAIAGARWATITLDDLEGSFAAWRAFAAAALTAGQRNGVQATDAYFAAYLAAELGRPQTEPPSQADELAGRARDGRDIAEVLAPALITIRVGLARGLGANRALQMGQARATRTLATELLAAPRLALDTKIILSPRVIGWRRVTSGNACGACLGAATGAIHKSAVTLRVHGFCRCTKEPVVIHVGDRHLRPTGQQHFDDMTREQQDQLFHGRGGAEKADLIRNGEISLEDLVRHQPMTTVPDEITETPLSALRR